MSWLSQIILQIHNTIIQKMSFASNLHALPPQVLVDWSVGPEAIHFSQDNNCKRELEIGVWLCPLMYRIAMFVCTNLRTGIDTDALPFHRQLETSPSWVEKKRHQFNIMTAVFLPTLPPQSEAPLPRQLLLQSCVLTFIRICSELTRWCCETWVAKHDTRPLLSQSLHCTNGLDSPSDKRKILYDGSLEIFHI